MKIAFITDAWEPQTNGVVRTVQALRDELERRGHKVFVRGPQTGDGLVPLPYYPEIRLALLAQRKIFRDIETFRPDEIHIVTEGPLGLAARAWCLAHGVAFTSAYHTQFPEYVARRVPAFARSWAARVTARLLKWFHAPSNAVMAATSSMKNELEAQGWRNVVLVSRGVEEAFFHPGSSAAYEGLARPILLYVGRVAVEKNIPAFLDLKTKGSKVVAGQGPDLKALKARYPDVLFLGNKGMDELPGLYAGADVFVFPSRTETFGLVLLEACAAGLRIAACPVPGPVDLFFGPDTAAFAVLDEDIGAAVARALALPPAPEKAKAFAALYTWARATDEFLACLGG